MPDLINYKLPAELALKIQIHAPSFDEMPCVVIIHNLPDFSVGYMSPRGLELLKAPAEEIAGLTNAHYHERYFNNEDAEHYVPKLLRLLERNNNDEMVTFFQQVRFPDIEGWSWHLSGTKIFHRDADGKPSLTITIALPIDSTNHITAKANRLLDENNFIRKNLANFSKLTNREKQILKLTTLGKSAAEIAVELFISITTAETHSRNIKQKLNAATSFELSRYAQAFDLI
jgi:DNA-binding CsgD family transcriptional regulator